MGELKALSKLKMAGKLHYWRGTIEIDEHELHAICDEIQAEHEQAVAATLGYEANPDGLPVGLTISDDGNLLNWRGENYVRQSTLSGGKLTADDVRETIDKHWHDLPAEYDMPEATALPEYSYDWQAIVDELNSRAERTCECIMCAYFENKSTCGAYCNYFDRELGDDYDGGCTWGVLSGCKAVS